MAVSASAVITTVSGVAAVTFLVAAIFGAQNYRKTLRISNYWGIFTIAMVLGTFLFVSEALEHGGIMTAAAEEIGSPLLIGFLVSLILATVESLTTDAHLTIR